MKKLIVILLGVVMFIGNVNAITSDGVTYDNQGNTEVLTDTLDGLLREADKYKTGGTVTANQMLKGATGYAKGELVTGTIESKGAETYTPGTTNQTINAGQYLSGTQTIKGDANLKGANIAAGKTIFGVSGTFTSDANAAAGHILSGKTAYVNGSKVTGTIPSKGAATYTPGTSNQTINSGQYLNGTQTIAGSANLVAANIKSGVNIFGVNGTFTSDANAGAAQILSGKTAYVNGSKVTGTIPSKGAATYTPGTSNQTINSGQYLSGAQTIKGDADLVAGNILSGVDIFGVGGSHTAQGHSIEEVALIHSRLSNGSCNLAIDYNTVKPGYLVMWIEYIAFNFDNTRHMYYIGVTTGGVQRTPILRGTRDDNTRAWSYSEKLDSGVNVQAGFGVSGATTYYGSCSLYALYFY